MDGGETAARRRGFEGELARDEMMSDRCNIEGAYSLPLRERVPSQRVGAKRRPMINSARRVRGQRLSRERNPLPGSPALRGGDPSSPARGEGNNSAAVFTRPHLITHQQ